MDAKKTRYEFIDPTNGDYGTAYTGDTKAEIIEKAEKVGAGRFNEIGPDDTKTAHVKVDGEWQLASEVERKQKAAAAVEALSRQIQNGVQHNEAAARQTPEERAEVAQATRDFGGDPVKDDERRAAIGIEARSIAFANASADAKHDKLTVLPAGDIRARLAELSQPEPNVLPADVSRLWAKLDAQEFGKIQGEGIESDARRETAANAIAANMAANAEYKAALVEAAPAVGAAASEAEAKTNRSIESKVTAKAMEAEAMAAVAGRDADAFEIPQRGIEQNPAAALEKTPAQALQAIQDRNILMHEAGQDVEDLTPDAAARLARDDQADYTKLDMAGKAAAAYTIADNFRNREYSAEFARHDPDAAQNVVREMARQDEAAAKLTTIPDADMDAMLAQQEAKARALDPAPAADPFADPQPAQPGADKQNGNKDADWDAAALVRMEEARRRDFAEVREAMRLNTIEPNIEREKQRLESETEAGRQAWLTQAAAEKQQPAKGAQPGQAPGGNGVESDEIFTATQADTKAIVPPEIEKQYLRVGDKFYHPKNTELVAFEDKGNKLETKSNSEAIAESMVRIAEARGWDEIKVTGSETFRREVWLEAAARGMHVKGYTPSEQDKAALAAKSLEAGSNSIEQKRPANAWNVQLAEAFAKEAPAEAVKKHPELAGAYGAMAAATKQAESERNLSPSAKAFVAARIKQNTVNAIERGDIPETKVREQVEQKREASNNREYAR